MNMQIRVKGWKTHLNNNEYTLRYNEEFVEISVHISSSTYPASWSEWSSIIPTSPDLRPKMPVLWHDTTGNVRMKVTDASTKISFSSHTGNNVSQSCYGMVTYSRR